ncbi:hypothetical protein DENSPDRAFT_883923 [Dentipellis sp. KUC8613]|nr:hypothetical protein DENSPDRAFT_883923 [Dentipellis sp. KUC8613]
MAPSWHDSAADQAQSRYEAYLSTMQYCDLIAERTVLPVPRWPQMGQRLDFHGEQHFSMSSEVDLLRDFVVEGSGYIAMPPSDIVDMYPVLQSCQQSLLFAPAAAEMEDLQAHAIVPQYEQHALQAVAVPVQAPQPVYRSHIAPAAIPENHGTYRCYNRMHPSTPLFTYEELDTWAALERGTSHSHGRDYITPVKLELEDYVHVGTSPDTSALVSEHVESGDPRASSSALRKGEAGLCAMSTKNHSTPPVVQMFPDAEEVPGKTPKASTSPSPFPSPLRARRRGIKKKEKPSKPPPFLACFFCRGRKIACTPLDPDSPDKTCE